MSQHARAQKPISDERADRMAALYHAEHDRWGWRRKLTKPGFELVRNSSPYNNVHGENYDEITNLTLRECSTRDHAELWLRTFAGRAAIRAALEAL